MKNQALDLAEKLCLTLMDKYKPQELPPNGAWHYHQGIFLLGMEKIYAITENEKYYDYIKAYVDNNVNEDGTVYYTCQFDNAMPGMLLFNIFDRTKDERYKKPLDHYIRWIPKFFKTESGGFWHKFNYPDQMWLDGFYMAQTLCSKYASYFGNHNELYDMAFEQLKIMKRFTCDEKTGLWYHAYDESRQAAWADKDSGTSPEFWGRAFGWIGAALADILEYMPYENKHREYFVDTFKEFAEAVINVQDKESSLWYQVLDKGDKKDNWIETSCSCLFIYAICKGIRQGILKEEYKANMQAAFEGLKKKLIISDDKLYVTDICIGTGVGDYKHYIERPRTENDLHGAGAFLLAMSEIAKG